MSLERLFRERENPEPVLLRGRVTVAPASPDGDLFVAIDALDPHAQLGPCRFSPKAGQLPEQGAAVLVAFDEQGSPWAAEWESPAAAALLVPWQPGDVKLTAAAIPAGWLACDGALLLRADYAALFAAIGTAYNVGGETGAQFRVPDLRSRVPVGAGDGGAGLTDRVLGALGGAETVALTSGQLASHSHGDGTLAVASHSHDDGTLSAASHTHGKGTLNITSSGSHSHDLSNGQAIVSSGAGGSAFSSGSYWATTGIAASSHAHPNDYFAGDTGSAAPDVTGSTGSASPDVTGSTAAAGSGDAHENMPPFAVVAYAIKT